MKEIQEDTLTTSQEVVEELIMILDRPEVLISSDGYKILSVILRQLNNRLAVVEEKK